MVEGESGAFRLYYLLFSYRIAFCGTILSLFFMSLGFPSQYWFYLKCILVLLATQESNPLEPQES